MTTIKESGFSLGKDHTLRSKKVIADLFEHGTRIKSYPFIAICNEIKHESGASVKWVFSAPKKKFRKAVTRNRIKRVCREAIRLNKGELEKYFSKRDKQLAIFLVYTADTELAYEELHNKTQKLLNTLIKHFDETVS